MTDTTAVLPPYLESLEIIADWKVDLSTRLKRALRRYELTGMDREEIVDLWAEVDAWKRLLAFTRR
jgi:hypothetical protein